MRLSLFGVLFCTLLLAACSSGGLGASDEDSPFAPGIDKRGEAVDGLVVGHRLMAAGEYELALDAFTRAAGKEGLTAEVLTGLGTANLGLGRLNQSEKLLRKAVDEEPTWAEAWNNLGVVLIERGQTAEAAEIFRKAFALDNGESTSIRDNLRLALEKLDNSVEISGTNQSYKLVRRGSSQYTIRRTP